MKRFIQSAARIAILAVILAISSPHREAHASAGMGALVGANTGVLLGLASWYMVGFSGGYASVYAPLIGGVAGAFIGAAVGSSDSQPMSRSGAELGTLDIGDRVRLSSPAFDEPLVGRIVDADETQITISYPDENAAPVHRTIDRSALDRIEQSAGKRNRVAAGLLIGAGAGALVGSKVSNQNYYNTKTTNTIVGAGLGALVGGLAGSQFKSESWNRLPPDTEVGLSIGGPSTPLALGVHVSFR